MRVSVVATLRCVFSYLPRYVIPINERRVAPSQELKRTRGSGSPLVLDEYVKRVPFSCYKDAITNNERSVRRVLRNCATGLGKHDRGDRKSIISSPLVTQSQIVQWKPLP